MVRLETLSRRTLLIRGSASAAMASFLAQVSPSFAQTPAVPVPAAWDIQFNRIVGDAKPTEGKIALELPESADNGNTVPFSILVESPMTPDDHIRAIHVLTTGNPDPLVAAFRLSHESGLAQVSSRMRLIKSQDIIAIAEVSRGQFHVARRSIKVTIGCCGY